MLLRNHELWTAHCGPPGPAPLDQPGPAVLEPRRGRGALVFGGIAALVLLALYTAGLALHYGSVTRKIRRQVELYTAAAPGPVPKVEVPEGRRREILRRAAAFEKWVRTPSSPEAPHLLTDEQRTLVLTGEELNVLLERMPEDRGKLHVTIDGEYIQAQVSLPLDDLPGLQGRYFNGEAYVIPFVFAGRPVAQLRNVRVEGRPLPVRLYRLLEGMNLAADLPPEDEKTPPLAHPLEKIEVKQGKVTLVARREGDLYVSPIAGGVREWKTEDGGNGHFYELVRREVDWVEAYDTAQERTYRGARGYLATITSAEENAFVRDRVAVDQLAWIGLTTDPNYIVPEDQDRGQPAPNRDGWGWVTGEPVTFRAWPEGRGGTEATPFGAFNGAFGLKRGQWTALADDPGKGHYFLVEYEPEPEDEWME